MRIQDLTLGLLPVSPTVHRAATANSEKEATLTKQANEEATMGHVSIILYNTIFSRGVNFLYFREF